MAKTIQITDETAQIVAQQSEAVGLSEAEIVERWALASATEMDGLRRELAARLADGQPALDGEAVFAELRQRHAARFGKP